MLHFIKFTLTNVSPLVTNSIVTKGSHGVFRSDDSYIVLESRIASQENDAYAEGDNQQDKIYRGWIWLGMTSKRHDETHAHVSQLKETLGLTIDFKIEKQKEEDEVRIHTSLCVLLVIIDT